MDEFRARELKLEEQFADGKAGTGWDYTFYQGDFAGNVAMCEFRFPAESMRIFFDYARFREFVTVAKVLLDKIEQQRQQSVNTQ